MITRSDLEKLRNRSDLERFLDKNYESDIAAFLKDLDKSINSLFRTNLKDASALADSSEKVFKYLPEKYYPRYLTVRGRIENWSGNHRQALKHYEKARNLLLQQGDREAVARLGKGLIDIYTYLGKYDSALEVGKYSLSYYRRHNRRQDVGQVLNNIGNIYHRQDNNRQALNYYNKARDKFSEAGGIPLAIVEFNRANIYANMNHLGEAEKLYSESARLYRGSGMDIAETQADYARAYLSYLDDRYTKAIKIFDNVHDKLSSLGDYKKAAVAELDMVEINIHLNQYGSAIMSADKIIPEFDRLDMPYEKAKVAYFAAEAHYKLGDYEKASKRLKQADRIFNREKNNLWMGMVQILKSRLLSARKQHKRSIEAAREAISYFKASKDERRLIDAETAFAEAMMKSGQTGPAVKEARKLLKRKPAGYQLYYIYYLTGRCYYIEKDYDKAIEPLKKAADTAEKMLAGLYPDEIRAFFAADKYDCYRLLVDCMIRADRVDQSYLTNLSALSLINSRMVTAEPQEKQVPAELIRARDQLRAALKKLNQTPGGEFRSVSEQQKDYYRLEKKLWATERKIRSHVYPENVPSTFDYRHPDPEKISKTDFTIINYFMTESRLGAFCTYQGKTDFIDLGLETSELEIILRKLHFVFEGAVFSLRDNGSTKHISREILNKIYKIIFEKLEPSIVGNNIVIIAEGILGQVPYHALLNNDGRYLKDRFQINLIVDPIDLENRVSPHISPKKAAAVFAVASGVYPAIDEEAAQIAKIWGKTKVYSGEEADHKTLLGQLGSGNGFVHIAAHAARSSENPLFSKILLGDGPFFPFDLFQTGINCDLVTLSGCQTAAPGLYYGNSFSLAKAFYQAGSRFVIASLWPVADKLSMHFMVEFYKSLKSEKDINKAYRSALNHTFEITDNPAFWGAFMLLGL